ALGSSTALVLMVIAAMTTGVGHGLSYWGANREIDVLTPPTQRAGITATLYIALYAGCGVTAIEVGMICLALLLRKATMFVNLALLLAIISFIPVPSLVQTTIRRSELVTFSADDS